MERSDGRSRTLDHSRGEPRSQAPSQAILFERVDCIRPYEKGKDEEKSPADSSRFPAEVQRDDDGSGRKT